MTRSHIGSREMPESSREYEQSAEGMSRPVAKCSTPPIMLLDASAMLTYEAHQELMRVDNAVLHIFMNELDRRLICRQPQFTLRNLARANQAISLLKDMLDDGVKP